MNEEKKQQEEDKRVNVGLKPNIYNRLKAIADKKAIQVGTLIRMILLEWLEKNQ